MAEPDLLLCHRCGAQGRAGSSGFYVVRIDSFADPAPPAITAGDLARDIPAELRRLYEQPAGSTARELMDQVHRRLIVHLCGPCYRKWIEDPTA
jgi:hypothetical protein